MIGYRYERLQNLSDKISDNLYDRHKEDFDRIFEERPTYVQVIDWMNDSEGWALFIGVDKHYEAGRVNSSIPFYRARFFRYGRLYQRDETFARWTECADDAIDCFFYDFRFNHR